MDKILAEISAGELIDKITILEIKMSNIEAVDVITQYLIIFGLLLVDINKEGFYPFMLNLLSIRFILMIFFYIFYIFYIFNICAK